jgi:ABC-type transporter lipoprotein component MlaA/pimeloyl-ACP methyl ester carboxylesterase
MSIFKRAISFAAAAGFSFTAFSQSQPAPLALSTNTVGRIALPASVPDPLEPMNRVLWSFNKGLLKGVIQPTARVYRAIVIKPIRKGIHNVHDNVQYPVRLANNLLQGRWTGARDETYRFLGNSTVGVGGIFDVARGWGIEASEADFGQTMATWGWEHPSVFLMLPVFGPSNERDAIGKGVDSATQPLSYFSWYDFDWRKPLHYMDPYGNFNIAATYNDLSDSVDETVRFTKASMDSYAEVQYVWTFARSVRKPNFTVNSPQDGSSLETLGAALVKPKSREFIRDGHNYSARIPTTGRNLNFTFWLQPKKAPVVYIVPGLGSHRLSQSTLALAEYIYEQGYSAVSLSSAYNAEFMENASTAALPASVPVDAHDLHVALTAIDGRLSEVYPRRLGERGVMGYSMGALHTLYIAATQETNSHLLQFERCLAIDTPVRLLHAIDRIDRFYEAPMAWPEATRSDRLENTFVKVASLAKMRVPPAADATLPFEAEESQFLVGLTFRRILRDIIYDSQSRTNLGILKNPIRNLRREALYEEIEGYSYGDYFAKFAQPYYSSKPDVGDLAKVGDLRTYGDQLRNNSKVYVIVNQNDFLLEPTDVDWLRATIPEERLTVLPRGGHLGNLGQPEVQKEISTALEGLKTAAH